jgi:hypothetical protein
MAPRSKVADTRSARITTSTTTVVKAGSGILHRIVIGTTAAGTITVNDALGTKLVLGVSYPIGSYDLFIACSGKIEIVTGGASDLTAVFD